MLRLGPTPVSLLLMFKLRILLLIVLLGEAAWLIWHVPWRAESVADERFASQSLGTAPWFSPPPAPQPKELTSSIMQYLEPHEVQTTVVVDGPVFFQKFAWLVVGTFFGYGLLGYFLTSRLRPADVAYSLALTMGYGIGFVASAIASYFIPDGGPLPWLSVFWALGIGLALLVTIRSRAGYRTAPPSAQ